MKLVSPVFLKEMVTLARSKRNYVIRALTLSALLYVMYISWKGFQNLFVYTSFVDMSELGNRLFRMFTLTQFFAVILLAPALTAPVIAMEKERNTLGLVLMTNLSPRNILLDKLLSRMSMILLLLLSGIPIFLVLLAFGGVEVDEIASSYVMIFASLLFCCGVGLRASTYAGNVISAMVSTYVILIGYVLGVVLLSVALECNDYDVLAEIVGFSALPIILFEGENTLDYLEIGGGTVILCMAVFCLISLGTFLLSLRTCAAVLPRVAEEQKKAWLKVFFERLNRFYRRINFTGITVMQDHAPLNNHPLLWKELHKRFSCSRIFLFRSGAVITALSLFLYMFMGFDDETALVMVLLYLSAIGLFAGILAATSFHADRNEHTLDLLLSTPQPASAFVLSRALGVWKSLSALILIPLLTMLLSVFPMLRPLWDWGHVMVGVILVIVACLPLVVLIGLYLSIRCRRVSTAILGMLGILVLWCVLPGYVAYLCDDLWFMEGQSWDESLLARISPIFWTLQIFERDFSFVKALPCLLGGMVLSCGGIALLVARFDELMGREESADA